MTNTAAPGFNRLISPGALARIGTSGPMLYSDSPPVKVTCSTAPCAALVTVPTVALVIRLSGIRSQANCRPPSGVALGKMRTSIVQDDDHRGLLCRHARRSSGTPCPRPGRQDPAYWLGSG